MFQIHAHASLSEGSVRCPHQRHGWFTLFVGLCTAVSLAQTRYPCERFQSPITFAVAENLRAVHATGQLHGMSAATFIKVGDSITVGIDYFMGQFIYPDHDPDTHDPWDYTRDLGDYRFLHESLDHFLSQVVNGGTTSFDRESLAAQVGAAASWAVSGNPSPLEQELAALTPCAAVIMFGTNDVGWYMDLGVSMEFITGNLCLIVDTCLDQGVIPILTAPPLRLGYEDETLTLSHCIRAISESRQIPFIDYHRAMMPLPGFGLRSDGVHPNTLDYNRSCHLTDEGLAYGYNQRNLLTLHALDRVHQIISGKIPAMDMEPPPLAGDGSSATPFEIDGIPFIDHRISSPEQLAHQYHLSVTEAADLRFLVLDQGDVDMDLILLDNGLNLMDQDDRILEAHLTSGDYYIRVETRDGTSSSTGLYQLVIMNLGDEGYPDASGLFLGGARVMPREIPRDSPETVEFSVTALDDSVVARVELDLTELGGPPDAVAAFIGQGRYAFNFQPAPSLPPGQTPVIITATDDQGHSLGAPVWLGILPAPLASAYPFWHDTDAVHDLDQDGLVTVLDLAGMVSHRIQALSSE